MRPITRRIVATVATGSLALACQKAKPAAEPPKPESHPLGGIVGQPLIIAPVQAVRVAPELGWTALPATAVISATLDSVLAQTLRVRVANQEWVYPEALAKSYANNRTYATDPRALSVISLRGPRLKVGDRLLEPLASQLRTMIALQNARLVLLPVELRFDRATTGLGRPVVRLVLVDPRSSVIRWFGDVTGPDSPTFTPGYSGSIADRVADLFVDR